MRLCRVESGSDSAQAEFELNSIFFKVCQKCKVYTVRKTYKSPINKQSTSYVNQARLMKQSSRAPIAFEPTWFVSILT